MGLLFSGGSGLRLMGHNEPIRETPRAAGHKDAAAPMRGVSEIPDKLYFRIGDVARICDVPAYVLRFWESEFPQLKPNKGGTGQRLYRRRDVEMALRIKRLLYDEGYTIPGARQLLKAEMRHQQPQLSLLGPEPAEGRKLQAMRRELESILALLSSPPGARPAPQPIRQRRSPQPKSPAALPLRSVTGEIPFDITGAGPDTTEQN